jgi:heat shock protein HslJ
MTMIRRTVPALVVLALATAGCGSSDDSAPAATIDDVPTEPDIEEPTVDVLDGDYDVIELMIDGERVELPDDRRVTMSIDGARIGGVAACNSYGGTLRTDRGAGGGTFTVGELSWTEMGCEPDVMAVEQAFLAALQAVDSYEVADGLYVAAAGTPTGFRLTRQAVVADAELVGTTWVLDTVISSGAASNSAAMATAYLVFDAAGTLEGSTGCRRLTGVWILDGSVLSTPELAAVDDPSVGVCSPEQQRLDGIVIGVVESGTTVQVDGDRLTLTAPGGEGLSYRVGDPAVFAPDDRTLDLDALEELYGLDPAGGVMGPVMYARRVDGDQETMTAEVRGELELDGDCLYMVLEGVRYPVLWPFGTAWDELTQSVVLGSGRVIPLGGEVDGGGGYLGGVSGFTDRADVIDLAAQCAEQPYREIAVLQSHAD